MGCKFAMVDIFLSEIRNPGLGALVVQRTREFKSPAQRSSQNVFCLHNAKKICAIQGTTHFEGWAATVQPFKEKPVPCLSFDAFRSKAACKTTNWPLSENWRTGKATQTPDTSRTGNLSRLVQKRHFLEKKHSSFTTFQQVFKIELKTRTIAWCMYFRFRVSLGPRATTRCVLSFPLLDLPYIFFSSFADDADWWCFMQEDICPKIMITKQKKKKENIQTRNTQTKPFYFCFLLSVKIYRNTET